MLMLNRFRILDFDNKKLGKFLTKFKFFKSKIAIFLFLGLHKGHATTGETFRPQFHVSFLPSWNRIQPTKIKADPDPQHCLEPYPNNVEDPGVRSSTLKKEFGKISRMCSFFKYSTVAVPCNFRKLLRNLRGLFDKYFTEM